MAISPAWSPDDRRIAFGAADGIYVVGVESGASPTLVASAPDAHSPAWSPDGRRIAFVSRGIYFTFGEESLGNLSTSYDHRGGRGEPEGNHRHDW